MESDFSFVSGTPLLALRVTKHSLTLAGSIFLKNLRPHLVWDTVENHCIVPKAIKFYDTMEGGATSGTTALVCCQLHSSFYTRTVQG